MPVLTAAQLAQLALDVGWRGDDVAVAVALALAVSGGQTDWHSEQRPGKGIRYWGLWGIDTDTYPGFLAHDLQNAGRTAQVAYALWTTHGPGWDWSPAWAGEAWREHLAAAQLASLQPRRDVPVGDTPPPTEEIGGTRAATGMIQELAGPAPLVADPPPVDWPPHQL